MTAASITTSPRDVRAALQDFKTANPRAHLRDAAHEIGVSECELVASLDGAIRLEPQWDAIMLAIPTMGRVKTMTRNDDAVIEKHGAYEELTFFGKVGQAVGSDIDLRIFLHAWGYGYAVTDTGPNGTRRSIQFFDHQGVSVHKIFEEPESTPGAFDAIVTQFRASDQAAPVIATEKAKPSETPDSEIDLAGFVSGWDSLKDTHDFFALLREFGVSRTQAFRLAGPERALPLDVGVTETILEDAVKTQRKIMIFVGSKGLIQIFTGEIQRVVRARGWLNILDDGFNLHLRDQSIATAWWVRKPTSDGIVNSVELYDANGNNIAMIFSKRHPGEPESKEWPVFLATLPVLAK